MSAKLLWNSAAVEWIHLSENFPDKHFIGKKSGNPVDKQENQEKELDIPG